jgi:hypothetical protein
VREIVSCTADDLADAFTKWERLSREHPERFAPEALRLRESPERYAAAAAPYFRQLLEEAGATSGDPIRRALAAGWTPPAPDYEPFWFHPDHGPVHEEDLAGVLDEEGAS